MKKRRCRELAMREHVRDGEGRCVVCGQIVGAALDCPGAPSEADVEHDFKPPLDSFTLPAAEYSPDQEGESPEAFTHDPDLVASGNALCPVCSCRPCLAGCRLGFSRQDLEDLHARW